MGFAGAHILPRKGDTLLPPDEKHGEAEYVGGAEEGAVGKGELEGGKRRRSSRLSGLFHRKEKGYKEGKGEEGDVVQ